MGPPPTIHDDLSSSLTDPNVDVVDLDLALNLLPSAILTASRAGKSVLSRGAPSLSSLRLLDEKMSIKSIASLTSSWSVVEQWSYKPGVLRVAELLDAGTIGRCARYSMTVAMALEDGVWEGEVGSCHHLIRVVRILFGEIQQVLSLEGIEEETEEKEASKVVSNAASDVTTTTTTSSSSSQKILTPEEKKMFEDLKTKLYHTERNVIGVLNVSTLSLRSSGENDEHARNQLVVQGESGRSLVWDMDSGLIRVILTSAEEGNAAAATLISKKVEEKENVISEEMVRGDTWNKGGAKEALRECLCHAFHSSLPRREHQHSARYAGGASSRQHDGAGHPIRRCSSVEGLRDANIVEATRRSRKRGKRERRTNVMEDWEEERQREREEEEEGKEGKEEEEEEEEESDDTTTAAAVLPLPLPLPLLELVQHPLPDVSGTSYHLPRWIGRCRSILQVQSITRWSHKRKLDMRPTGSGHSWSTVGHVAKGGVVVDTRLMSRVLWVESGVVCVQPGVSLRSLCTALHARGLCLPCLPVLLRQTVGGAVSTGSHGSSMRCASLSCSVFCSVD